MHGRIGSCSLATKEIQGRATKIGRRSTFDERLVRLTSTGWRKGRRRCVDPAVDRQTSRDGRSRTNRLWRDRATRDAIPAPPSRVTATPRNSRIPHSSSARERSLELRTKTRSFDGILGNDRHETGRLTKPLNRDAARGPIERTR